jgi:hypothetical protein
MCNGGPSWVHLRRCLTVASFQMTTVALICDYAAGWQNGRYWRILLKKSEIAAMSGTL